MHISTRKPSFEGPNKKKKNEGRKTVFDLGERRSWVCEVNVSQVSKLKLVVQSWKGRTNRRMSDFYLQNIFPKKSKQTRFSSEKGLLYSKLTEHDKLY